MRLRSPWVLIVVGLAVLLFALAALIDIARRPPEVVQPQVAEAEALVSLAASPEEAQVGDELAVTIHAQDVTNAYGGSVKLSFDPQTLEVIVQSEGAVVPGDFFADQPSMSMRNRVDVDTGIIEYALTLRQPATPVSGDGVLGTIRMRVLEDAPATIDVVEAQLLSPRFENVEGRTVATQVDTIPVKVQGITVNGGAQAVATPHSIATATAAPERLNDTVVAVPRQPANANFVEEMVSRFGNGSSPGIVVGAVFFLAGLLLLLIGLRTYVRLYRRYGT